MFSQTKRSGGSRRLRSRSAHHPVPSLNFLQRTAGNRAVASLFETRIQRSPEDEKKSGEKGTPNPLLVKQFEMEIIKPAKRSVRLIRSGRRTRAYNQLLVVARKIRQLHNAYENSDPQLALSFLTMHTLIVTQMRELEPRELGEIADSVENEVVSNLEGAKAKGALEGYVDVIGPAKRSVPLIRSGRVRDASYQLLMALNGIRGLHDNVEKSDPELAQRLAAMHTIIVMHRRELAPAKLGKIADSVENEVVKNLEGAKGALK